LVLCVRTPSETESGAVECCPPPAVTAMATGVAGVVLALCPSVAAWLRCRSRWCIYPWRFFVPETMVIALDILPVPKKPNSPRPPRSPDRPTCTEQT
jgi:hypothetical protein